MSSGVHARTEDTGCFVVWAFAVVPLGLYRNLYASSVAQLADVPVLCIDMHIPILEPAVIAVFSLELLGHHDRPAVHPVGQCRARRSHDHDTAWQREHAMLLRTAPALVSVHAG